MTVSELIKKLEELPEDREIMILDSCNGGGHPREINLGPAPRKILMSDADDNCDCEATGAGTDIYVIGFGCY